MDKINRFREENFFLSNFYPCPVEFEGHTYHSSEAAYQAQKDPSLCNVFETLSAADAKKLGKKVDVRHDWEWKKYGIMRAIVFAKFFQNEALKDKLLATGDTYLEEGNDWGDTFWGVCNDVGENYLGKILMLVRAYFRGEETK